MHRLHFEYGYSATKIADLMKVNRNTINGDIDYWYSKIFENSTVFTPESTIVAIIERLDVQRTRLREQLDKAGSFQERFSLEKLIFDIDCRIAGIYQKITQSVQYVMKIGTENLNKWLKDNNRSERYLTLFDKITVSKEAQEKIDKIIEEDRKRIGKSHA